MFCLNQFSLWIFQGEIKKVMDLGVSGEFRVNLIWSFNVLSFVVLADRIIYANPCKQASYIRYAEEVGVETMTFDNEQELLKIKQMHSTAK